MNEKKNFFLMEEILNELKTITTNAKKKANQPYSRETVENKKQEIKDLEVRYNECLEFSDKDKDNDNLVANFTELKNEAISALNIHIVKRNRTAVIMANLDMKELSTIIGLVPMFTGNREELASFLSSVDVVHETITTEKRHSFFSFIFRSRLDLKVQNRIKQNSVPTSIDELKAALRTCYKPVKSANSILNELTKIVQRGNNLMGFAGKIEYK